MSEHFPLHKHWCYRYSFDILILNMLGQTVYSFHQPVNSGTSTFHLPNINPGNYFLILRDASGAMLHRKLVKHYYVKSTLLLKDLNLVNPVF